MDQNSILGLINDNVYGIWFLVGAALVFFMQCGFAMVEAGFTRAKNAGNIIMKNLMDFCLGTVVFILIGFGLLCGEDLVGIIGKPGFDIFSDYANFDWSSFVFNLVFCATAATIVSGAMAERTKFISYCIYSAVISAVIYPVETHWVWGGGWLSQLSTPFHDFAGSGVIHMVGGISALIGAAILGPRIGKFTKTKDGKNVPLWMGIKLCVTNKYFIMFFMLAVFLSFYEAVTGTCNAYYAQYILGNRDLLGALASFESIPQIVTVLVLSPFIAKFGKRNVALIGAIVAVIGTVSLFINPSALNLALFACVMRGIGKGCFRGVKYSMLADVIEYGAWKSGIRVQGLMVSATTAGQKFGSGMTSAIFGALMSLVGFAGTVTINAAQSQMLIGIYIIGNIIAWGGIGVLLIFYKLDKIYPRIITEMKQREAAEAEKAAANA